MSGNPVYAAVLPLLNAYLGKAVRCPRRYWRLARDVLRLWRIHGEQVLQQITSELGATQSEALVRQYISAQLATSLRGGALDPYPASGSAQLRIVIGMIGDFGDIVASEPVVRYLRRLYPNAEISWVVRDVYRELIDTHPDIDHTIAVGCLTDWMKCCAHMRFDRVIDLHMQGHICHHCRIPLNKQDGDFSITRKNYLKHGSLLQVFCKSAGLPTLDDTPKVYLTPEIINTVDSLALPERYVVIHTKSNSYQKDWNNAHWVNLARHVIAMGYHVVEIGLTPSVQSVGDGYYDACGKTSFLGAAEIIRHSVLFVGVDSGPAHLANALGSRAVIVLGQFSRFKIYNPYSGDYGQGRNVQLVRNRDGHAADLDFEPVLEVVSAALVDHQIGMATDKGTSRL